MNYDDSYLFNLKNELKAEVFGITSKNKQADLVIKDNFAYYKKEDKILLDFNKINLPGAHNQKNAAFAALAAYLAGQKVEKIQSEAENYKLQSHRMEFVENPKNYLIIDDSKATNPDSTLKALQSIEKDIILIAGGQDRNADFSNLKEVIKNKVKTLILVGETSAKLESLFRGSNLEIITVETMEAAAKLGAQKLNESNSLLLSPACPSWDMFNSYKERGEIFQKSVLKYID